MKHLFLLLVLFIAPFHKAQASVEDILKNSTAEVVNAGHKLNNFSDYLSSNFNETFSFIQNVSRYLNNKKVPFSATKSVWSPIIFQFIKIFLIFALSALSFFVIQRFIFHVWLQHPQQKGVSIHKGDQIFFYIVPWIFFIILGHCFTVLFGLLPLLSNTISSFFFIIATIFPIKQVAFLSYKLNKKSFNFSDHEKLKKVAPPFIYWWVVYLFSLGLLTMGLILFFSFIFPLLQTAPAKIGKFLYNHFTQPSIIFPEQLFFYFYLMSLSLFILSLELFVETEKKAIPAKKMHPVGYYWAHYGKYWNYLTRFGIVCSFIAWLGAEATLVPYKAFSMLLGITFLLFIVSSRTVTLEVLRYISSQLTARLISSKILNILNFEKFFRWTGYLLYYFLCFYFFIYLWGIEHLLHSIEHYMVMWVEKILLIALTLFIAFSIKSFLLSIIGKILASRTQAEIAARSGNRVYTFLTLLEALLPPLIWIPSFTLVFIFCGISGKIILMIFAAIGALLVWVGQNVMQDMIKGLMYMVEDVVVIGEEVTINHSVTGRIERLSLHSLSLRDFNGLLHTYSFGKIESIGSSEWKFINLVVEVIVDYDSDLEKSIGIMEKIIKDMRKQHEADHAFQQKDLEVYVDNFTEYGVHLKARIKMTPGYHRPLKTIYYRHLKQAFDKHRIRIARVEPYATVK